jgi:uncharacterized cupredoxin-like copper-binding protein
MTNMPRSFTMLTLAAAFAGAAVLSTACGSDSGDRRVIDITQVDGSCEPASINVEPGEKVTFRVDNQSKKDKEVEGIEGAKVEEILVPSGKVRNVNYTAPKDAGTDKIKCYTPGADSTIIAVNIGEGGGDNQSDDDSDAEGAGSRVTDADPKDDVTVDLIEYSVTPDKLSAKSGPVKFTANNTSTTQVHELAVLRVKENGDFENTGEVEDIDPGKSGEVVLDLPAGDYVLACLIAPGEAGSTVDHFQEGMKIDFQVE